MFTGIWLLFTASGMKLYTESSVQRMCKNINEIQGSLKLKWYVIAVCLAFILSLFFVGQMQIVIFALCKLPVHGQYTRWTISSLLEAYLYVQCMSNKVLSKTDWSFISSWINSWINTFCVRSEQRSVWQGNLIPKCVHGREKRI